MIQAENIWRVQEVPDLVIRSKTNIGSRRQDIRTKAIVSWDNLRSEEGLGSLAHWEVRRVLVRRFLHIAVILFGGEIGC